MALVKSGEFGSSPTAQYEIHADQTAGSGTKRTVRVTMKLKVKGSGSSRYAYPLNWKGKVGSHASGWMKVKGNETWYGTDSYRSFSWTETVDVGTTSAKTIAVGFQLDMTAGSSSWETTQTGNFTTGATLTAPPAVKLSASGVFEEGQTQTLSWTASSTASHYKVWYQVYYLDTGKWSSWLQHGGDIKSTSYSITHKNIGGNKYGAIYYTVNAYNAAGTSPNSNTFTFEHYGVRVWNGSSWVWGKMRVWNGSSWVKSVPRVWRDGAWRYS